MLINKLKQTDPALIVVGSHPGIIQSILDYDFLIGREKPTIKVIIASGKKFERYFFGRKEILLPHYSTVEMVPQKLKKEINMFVSATSARRVLLSTVETIDAFPNIFLGVIFAENVPEKHAIEISEFAKAKNISIIGPASVGILLPQYFKLGAIGGIDYKQLSSSGILEKGGVAVFSASGGMVNEVLNIVGNTHNRISFSLSFGGDRFPIFTPFDAFKAAEEDEDTKAIVYYGELGGQDEYKFAEMIANKEITIPVICYIGGVVSDLFETPPQFGHAKAMAGTLEESAKSKRDALEKAGAQVAKSFSEFVEMVNSLPDYGVSKSHDTIMDMDDRKHALFASSISKDDGGETKILGENILSLAKENSFAKIAASLFLGKKITSKDTEELVDFILRVSVDHGPYVSGAVNTMVTARAGRDLVSSLASGLLTIGPRFGGALNEAAKNWFSGVVDGKSAHDFVEEFAVKKEYIQGIGHKKYRIDMPDPRVDEIKKYADKLEQSKFLNFALEIEKITTEKKGNLILNVDGVIAAVLLDYLSEKEGYTDEQLWELIQQEFFNALFVLSRSVGFIAHFLDQKRLDEGLFRLSEDDVADASLS